MTPDNLPYNYSTNGGALSQRGFLIHLAASAMMGALNYFGVTTIPTWLVCLPLTAIFVRFYTYRFLTNAFHEALRNAERDSYLDEVVSAEAEARDAEKRKGALTPGFFNEKFLPQASA